MPAVRLSPKATMTGRSSAGGGAEGLSAAAGGGVSTLPPQAPSSSKTAPKSRLRPHAAAGFDGLQPVAPATMP